MTKLQDQLQHVDRDLGLTTLENARDLGGYRTSDGSMTRWQVFVRTGDMNTVSAEDQQRLIDYGVSTVCDLRMQHERDAGPNVFANAKRPVFQVHDFWGDRFDDYRSGDKAATPAKKLADLYCHGLEKSGFVMAEIIGSLAAVDGGAAFHCRSGKDRTGLVAAMLLGIAGVPNDTICADFALTGQYLKSEAINPIEASRPGAWQRTSEPETMQRTLQFVEHGYGGIKGYLESIGVPESQLVRIRERFVG